MRLVFRSWMVTALLVVLGGSRDPRDYDVAIKAGDDGPATHMTIAHNHFYSGHGMSIGSATNGGARAIRVSDLTIDGARPGDLTAAHADVRIGPRRGNVVPSGEGVVLTDEGSAAAAPLTCEGRFEPFPDLPTAPAVREGRRPPDPRPPGSPVSNW
jgi:hypothetical protein